jgi:cysteine desulfurase
MAKVMAEDFGNPSSTHSFGRNAKSVLELSRKSIAKRLNASKKLFYVLWNGSQQLDTSFFVADLKVSEL